MVDPSAFGTFDLASTYGKGVVIREKQQEMQDKRRLRDLLPVAMGRGGISEAGATQAGQPQQQAAMSEIAAINPEMFLKLDERQRKQAESELEDLSAAVRWADTPEKWQQVQQYYTSHGHDVSAYPFESREQSLIALGQMGNYLKGNKTDQPSSVREYEYAKQQGFNGSFVDYQNQMGSPIMVDNGDGTKTLYPRSMLNGGGQQQAPQSAPPQAAIDMLKSNPSLAPQFDQKYGPGASQRALGGQSASPTGGFPR